MDADDRLARLRDPSLPASAMMLGADAAAMLRTAPGWLDAPVGSARPTQVLWSPGRRLIVRYSVSLASGREDVVIAATGSAIPIGLRDGDPTQVLVWPRSADPHLPGLDAATHRDRVRAMLETLGLRSAPIRLRLRTYRPTRRAVVQVIHPDATVYLKVVSPAEAERLDATHRFEPGVRTPRCLGWSRRLGIVVLEALPGITLRECLADLHAALPPPERIVGLLDDLRPPPQARPVGGPRARLRRHSRLLRRLVPEHTHLIDTVEGACAELRPSGGVVAVHGDYYENQVLVTDGTVSGLIDLDRSGLGRRVDDIATMIAHLASWAPSAPDPARVAGYGGRVLAEARSAGHDAALRGTVAAALVGLATGPFRTLSPEWPDAVRARLEAAVAWLAASAEHEKDLITVSDVTHRTARR